jgi:IMP cyclohydrolase
LNPFQEAAAENLRRLSANPYPGRGIVLGLSEDGRTLVQLYWIMGRSENSRNRRFVEEDGVLRTRPVDLSKVADPSLIIYAAMREVGGHFIVTNGDQTDTISDAIAAGGSYVDALRTREHEPDAPNWTPRISGGMEVRRGLQRAWMAIIKADPAAPNRSVREFFEYTEFSAGYGVCLTTYEGDGDPLPSYVGEPRPVPLTGDAARLGQTYWDLLDGNNRISLAARLIDLAGGGSRTTIINRFAP